MDSASAACKIIHVTLDFELLPMLLVIFQVCEECCLCASDTFEVWQRFEVGSFHDL